MFGSITKSLFLIKSLISCPILWNTCFLFILQTTTTTNHIIKVEKLIIDMKCCIYRCPENKYPKLERW